MNVTLEHDSLEQYFLNVIRIIFVSLLSLQSVVDVANNLLNVDLIDVWLESPQVGISLIHSHVQGCK